MRNSQSLHWMGVMKWMLITGLLSGLGLSYMLYKNHNLSLADETHKLQIKLDAIKKRNDVLALDLETMKSSKMLEARLRQMHSALVHYGDPSATWIRFDENPRARLARLGTMPNRSLSRDSSPPTAQLSP